MALFHDVYRNLDLDPDPGFHKKKQYVSSKVSRKDFQEPRRVMPLALKKEDYKLFKILFSHFSPMRGGWKGGNSASLMRAEPNTSIVLEICVAMYFTV